MSGLWQQGQQQVIPGTSLPCHTHRRARVKRARIPIQQSPQPSIEYVNHEHVIHHVSGPGEGESGPNEHHYCSDNPVHMLMASSYLSPLRTLTQVKVQLVERHGAIG